MVRLRAIGECVIEVGEGRIGPDAELAFALLLVLTMGAGRPFGRRQLIDLLWPGTTEPRARHNLRQALYKLRQLGAPVEAEPNRVLLPLAARAPDALLDPDGEGLQPADLLRHDRPFGEFLAGYAPGFSAPLAAWVDEQRGVMHARLRRSILTLLEDERRRGNWGAMETLARKCLQLDPLNDEATLALAEATALTGSKRAALAILDGYLRELGDARSEIRLPASVLRRRIAERLPAGGGYLASEAHFLGRAESMTLLTERFREARAGSSRALLLWGDAGVGKSRLLAEFAGVAALEGAQVARVGCQERDVDRPLSLFIELVPTLLGLPGALGIAPESMQYLRRLTAHDPAVVEPSAATREAELLFANVRRAILDLVDAIATESPVVLCLEDLQWLDESSWRVLRELLGWLGGRRVLVLLTSRLPHATPQPPARPAPNVEPHRLAPLTPEHAAALLDALTATADPPSTFRDWSLQVADGNPLFLRLLAEHWIEKRELEAPPTVERILDDRLARLSTSARRVLQACAVLGSYGTVVRLAALLEVERHVLIDALAELDHAALVRVGGQQVECRHELVLRAAQRSISTGPQAVLYRAAAEVLELDAVRTHSVSLLRHCIELWNRAGDSERALALVRSCATHMLELGLPHFAADLYQSSVALCQTEADRALILLDGALAARNAGMWQQVLVNLSMVREIEALSASSTRGHSEHELLELEALFGAQRDVAQLLPRASRCALDPNASLPHRVQAASLGMMLADNLFDRVAMESIFSRLHPLMSESPLLYRTSYRIEAIYHNAIGDINTAVRATRSWLRLERRANDPVQLSRALRNATVPLRTAGELDAAFAYAVESFDIAVRHHLPSSAANSADTIATLNLARGDLAACRMWLARAKEWAGVADEHVVIISLRRLDARLAIVDEDWERARTLVAPESDTLAQEQVTRMRLNALAVQLLTFVGTRDRALVGRLLPQLEQLYQLARSFGQQDITVAALIRALRYVGEDSRATSLTHEYLEQHRRELSPISFELESALSAF